MLSHANVSNAYLVLSAIWRYVLPPPSALPEVHPYQKYPECLSLGYSLNKELLLYQTNFSWGIQLRFVLAWYHEFTPVQMGGYKQVFFGILLKY